MQSNQPTRAITLGRGVIYRANSHSELPSSDKTLGADDFGLEYTLGHFIFEPFETLFPYTPIEVIPLPEACLPSTILAQNIAKSLSHFPSYDAILVDWPATAQPFLKKIIETNPAAVALVPSHLADNGELPQREASEPPPEILLFEPMDPRRLFLHQLLKQHPNIPIYAVGNDEPVLCKKIEAHTSIRFSTAPQELLTRNSVLGVLQDELAAAAEHSSRLPWHALASQIAAHGSAQRLLLLTGSAFLAELFATEQRFSTTSQINSYLTAGEAIPLSRHTRSQATHVLVALAAESVADLVTLPAFIVRDLMKEDLSTSSGWIDFLKVSFSEAFKRAAERYADFTRMGVSKNQERDYFRFVYRLAATSGNLIPSNFDIAVAARATVDSNFAYEWLKEIRDYPEPTTAALQSMPRLAMPLSAFVTRTHAMAVAQFDTMQRYTKNKPKLGIAHEKHTPRTQVNHQPIDESKYADNTWVDDNHPYQCSFPDEDIFMEDYALQYRKQVSERVRAAEITIRELDTSMGDGLDFRETIRNWHKNKLMIKEELQTGKADIGSVVFHFAKPETEDQYTWKTLWLAEAHDKSHLMFYATPFRDRLIGPGIAQSEFGGFAVIPLDFMLDNLWSHPYIQHHASTPAEALLLAGALATRKNSVLFISHTPPSREILTLLRRNGKHVITIKLEDLPPDKIRRLRTFHILAEAGVRAYASKYIRKEFE